MSAETDKLSAIHIADNDGVTFKTCTAEVFRPVSNLTKTQGFRGTRPARTPPSTFLFLHLHLSNSPGPKPHTLMRVVRQPRIRRQMTTGEPVVLALIRNEELDGHENSSWPRAKTAPRSVGRVIGLPDLPCQRSLSINRRIEPPIFAPRRSRTFWGLRAALEPQSCDVLTYS